MSARVAALVLASGWLAGCAAPSAVQETAKVTLPQGWNYASLKPRPDMATICAGKKDWSDPGPPVPVWGNVYHVGTCTITVLLVATPEGHFLIDAATQEAVPSILANIRQLGFDPRDVRWLLSSHEHYDHSGGLAAMKAATGAKLAANAAAVDALQSGRPHQDDPQAPLLDPQTPVRVDRVLANGDTLTLGGTTLTMHATPAHAPGSTSWSWTSAEDHRLQFVVYADSLSTPAPDGYRFADNPEFVARYRKASDTIAALDCSLLLTPHPGQSAMYERYAGKAPLADPGACRDYAEKGNRALDQRIAKERAR